MYNLNLGPLNLYNLYFFNTRMLHFEIMLLLYLFNFKIFEESFKSLLFEEINFEFIKGWKKKDHIPCPLQSIFVFGTQSISYVAKWIFSLLFKPREFKGERALEFIRCHQTKRGSNP